MACRGLRQIEFRFAAELVEVSLTPLKSRSAQVPEHSRIGQNARQPGKRRPKLYRKRGDRGVRHAPLDRPRARVEFRKERAQHLSDGKGVEVAGARFPSLNQQQLHD